MGDDNDKKFNHPLDFPTPFFFFFFFSLFIIILSSKRIIPAVPRRRSSVGDGSSTAAGAPVLASPTLLPALSSALLPQEAPRTLEQAVEHVLAHPSESLFMQAGRHGPPEVVEQPRAGQPYLVVSQQGIMTMVPGEPTEFQSLADWQREEAAVAASRRIGLVRNFKLRKAFSAWRRLLAMACFSRTALHIRNSLLTSSSFFRPCILRVRGQLLHLSRLSFLTLDPQATHAFGDLQQHCAQAVSSIDQAMHAYKAAVAAAVHQATAAIQAAMAEQPDPDLSTANDKLTVMKE
jgi:hypothetical protein